MRLELCNFSGYKIYPGRGIRYVRADGKLLVFHTKKSLSMYKTKTNPRSIAWTVLYRKIHKKGQTEDVQKKRNKKTVKFQRAVDGNTLQSIMEKRNQTTEFRKAQIISAIEFAKQKLKEKREKKVEEKSRVSVSATKKNIKMQTKSKMNKVQKPKINIKGKR